MALRQLSSPSMLESLNAAINGPMRASFAQPLWRPLPQILPPIRIPLALTGIFSIPSILEGIWESILRAVPKKKTSYRKKRQRLLAGKALKDITELNRCSACGRVKRAHILCAFCVQSIISSRARNLTKNIWSLKPLSSKHKWDQKPKKLNMDVDVDVQSVVSTNAKEVNVRPASTTMKSKQYLTLRTIEDAHATDIFAIAPTKTHLITASGGSSLRVYDTQSPDIPLVQELKGAHKLGCHHLATSKNGKKAASAGFEGKVKVWVAGEGSEWVEAGEIVDSNKAGEIWAVALSEDGSYLASTTYDGRINVWDLKTEGMPKIREYETKGSFGMCVDLSIDGRFTASGHENGGAYIFNNDSGRMLHSLPGLVKPIRSVAFSPLGTLLAAAGDARIIALYDVASGEQVANLSGHGAWIFSLSWNETGEYLLSGASDGRSKVWSTDTRQCVATHSESDQTIWSVTWLPKTARSEMFVTAGASRGISLYREATGG
ncbi:WD40 repeat-like protein [Pseudovirgaria hyperparasitica]|uniref:WD40 repeat-like protein n=1 Tax=Pseudovirgaria hyperparasitica TaxID=470096 RepID=A0A6A6W983_9PEZI|nr:WD40 repeat-like protein [Pseudovirgaria hyperparasitica]KAF2759438.1 WD40 repeat-like protein [Pseudovirgaria hyperparasitica]